MKKSKQLIKIPHFARTMGKDIIPDPMAVPESKHIAPNCFFIKTQ